MCYYAYIQSNTNLITLKCLQKNIFGKLLLMLKVQITSG